MVKPLSFGACHCPFEPANALRWLVRAALESQPYCIFYMPGIPVMSR